MGRVPLSRRKPPGNTAERLSSVEQAVMQLSGSSEKQQIKQQESTKNISRSDRKPQTIENEKQHPQNPKHFGRASGTGTKNCAKKPQRKQERPTKSGGKKDKRTRQGAVREHVTSDCRFRFGGCQKGEGPSRCGLGRGDSALCFVFCGHICIPNPPSTNSHPI